MKCSCEFPEIRVPVPQRRLGRVKEYDRWKAMVRRCYNPDYIKYKDYGGRGIRVCKRWLESFQDYLEDVGERPGRLTIDREDNDGHYCPCNFRWASYETQLRNRRNCNELGPGITLHKEGYQATICIDGAVIYIGFSKDLGKIQRLYRDTYFAWFGKVLPEFGVVDRAL